MVLDIRLGFLPILPLLEKSHFTLILQDDYSVLKDHIETFNCFLLMFREYMFFQLYLPEVKFINVMFF